MCVSVCVSWEGGKGVEVQGFCWVVTEDREVKSNEEPPKVKDSEIQARERRSQPTSFAFALALAWQARKKKKKEEASRETQFQNFPGGPTPPKRKLTQRHWIFVVLSTGIRHTKVFFTLQG